MGVRTPWTPSRSASSDTLTDRVGVVSRQLGLCDIVRKCQLFMQSSYDIKPFSSYVQNTIAGVNAESHVSWEKTEKNGWKRDEEMRCSWANSVHFN